LGHQFLFLGPLMELGLPVLALAGIFGRQCSGMGLQANGLGIGLFGRVDMFSPIKEPLVRQVG